MKEQGEIVDGLRERYERVVVEDKGVVFNSDLTQALELGFLLELAAVHGHLRASPARRAAAPTRGPHDFPDRDDENFLRHTLVTWADGAPDLDWRPVTVTKWQPQERKYSDVTVTDATAHKPEQTMEVALKIWRYNAETGDRALVSTRSRRPSG